jgi:hypothetical protein
MKFEELVGKTITKITGQQYSDELVFHLSDGTRHMLYHWQNCCESVSLNDVNGNFEDLIGTEILMASEESNSYPLTPLLESDKSYTWTFYRLSTIKGTVVLRWLGVSNGHYSESVDFEEIR